MPFFRISKSTRLYGLFAIRPISFPSPATWKEIKTDTRNCSDPINPITRIPLMNRPSSDRRFLTLPAVHPCCDVSPEVLLDDLSCLASDIEAAGSRRSNPFPTHRRAARDAHRHAALLLAFLDDLRRRPAAAASIPSAAVLALSDLHVTLQKLRLLLHDCSGGGARLWILMNAPRVAGEFQNLLRSAATALDVLPLNSLDLSDEIRDLVRLLSSQARRVKVGVEQADALAAKSVLSILAQFQSGESADPRDLRRVLDHLKITSWIDCFAEVAFLEEEILADEEGGESVLLWSLMGLMVYSLVVLFDPPPDFKRCKIKELYRRQESENAFEFPNSDSLRCPISLELMKDPVTVSTGQTYDRASILRWLKSGHQTCPVTGEKLATAELVPNSAVRKLMSLYCHESRTVISEAGKSRTRDLSKTLSPASPAAVVAIRMAATVLTGKLASGDSKKKSMAAHVIRLLSKSNIFNRICLVESGSVRWLLCLLPSPDPLLQDNAIAALLNLSKHHSGRTDIYESGDLLPVVKAMKNGNKIETQQNAAAILFYLSAMEQCRVAIGEIPEAVPALVELLRNGTCRGKKNAVAAIYGLLLFPGNQSKILAADTVAVISDLLPVEEDDLAADCITVLAKIAERPDGTNTILMSSAVAQFVKVLRSSTSRSGKEYCISALLSLCRNGGDRALSLLQKTPLLIPSLYAVLAEGSPQTCKKARSLLNCIHEFIDRGYSPALAPERGAVHDPAVHAL